MGLGSFDNAVYVCVEGQEGVFSLQTNDKTRKFVVGKIEIIRLKDGPPPWRGSGSNMHLCTPPPVIL